MKKSHKNILRHRFVKHISRNVMLASIAILLSLYIGMLGYHNFEHMTWVDAFLNAAMILSGMGPITALHSNAGKIFAGCYAIFSGLMFIIILGLLLAPIAHHLFLKIKVDTEN